MQAVITVQLINVVSPRFSNENSIVFISHFAQVAQNIVYLRQSIVVDVVFVGIAVDVLSFFHWIVMKIGIFKQSVNRIQAEAGDSVPIPPAGDIEHGVPYCGVAPVQIGLLGIKEMIVVLVGS